MNRFVAVFLCSLLAVVAHAAPSPEGKVVDTVFVSKVLQANRIGIDPRREVKVYLPAGYEQSKKSYPVIYYLHSIF